MSELITTELVALDANFGDTKDDVIKALALGARGVFIGRAFLYGLGAMGVPCVTLALDLIRRELDTTMALCGLRDIQDVDRRILLG